MQLSEHFHLDEFTKSQIAARLGFDNTPSPEIIENLKRTAHGMELVRTRLGGLPIIISSGYRCLSVNRTLGSKDTSYHTLGLACDFTCHRFGSVDDVFLDLVGSSIEYDKLIIEYNAWIHIQFPKEGEEPRRQSYVIDKSGISIYKP